MKIINVIASSLDGCIAAAPLESDQQRQTYELTSQEDQEHVRQMMWEADAIITGAESVRASGTLRPEKNKHGRYPLWVILTTRGLDKNLHFWHQSECERWLISPTKIEIHDKKVKNFVTGAADIASFIAKKLGDQGIHTTLLFGGGKVNALFYAAGLVDELYLTLSPVLVGNANASRLFDIQAEESNLPVPLQLKLLSCRQSQNQLFLRYSLRAK